MRIVSLTLRNYLPFAESAIRELHVTFHEDVQLVIGSNGSGKSSLVKQLTPYPPVRSIFTKNGFKSLVLKRGETYYRLETEFEKPSSPHLFFEGDNEENLNIGRTTQTQVELIQEHLGITPLIDNLMMNRYTFPRMTPSVRKEFLMSANPDKIGFVLKLIKQTSSKVKACRNNLSRLQARKIILEHELLTPEQRHDLEQEKQTIEKELSQYQGHLMNLEIALRTLPSASWSDITNLPQTQRFLKRARARLVHLSF